MEFSEPCQRPIKRILVANRGEIAIRILQACHELPEPPTTYAIYTEEDATHINLGQPNYAIRIPSPSAYMDLPFLVKLVQQHNIDAVHPGYGFLSESPDFSHRMSSEADCFVIGPGAAVLKRTGDKLKAKQLATDCSVPILRAMSTPTANVDVVKSFVKLVGLPVMIKAVDGGGGRGIRLVTSEDSLENAVERCIGESPSAKVFVEKAAVNGFKHIEVQIIGDGKGNAQHLWERDCSVQRRFQKIVEVAPTPTHDRKVIIKVIKAALKMARYVKYLGLGTFEFLVNVSRQEFYFLEINPRLQVEHTISESISGIDLVKEQLMIAQGIYDDDTKFAYEEDAITCPQQYSIQWRLCAEDPNAKFALSIGKVLGVYFPTGNGVRVDSHLSHGGVVGSDFDNLLAKVIITASTWQEAVLKSKRALSDTVITGVKTNLNLLRAIAEDRCFRSGEADIEWLEKNLQRLIHEGDELSKMIETQKASLPITTPSSQDISSNVRGAITSFRRGDAWSLTFDPQESENNNKSSSSSSAAHHLRIDKIARNEFPEELVADISYTIPGTQPKSYKVKLTSTSSSLSETSSTYRRGDPNDKSHIILPMSGKLIEVLVEEGDEIQEGQVIAFVKQMKMELEVRSPRAGKVKWVIELDKKDGGGDDAAAGVLLAELENEMQPVQLDMKSKL